MAIHETLDCIIFSAISASDGFDISNCSVTFHLLLSITLKYLHGNKDLLINKVDSDVSYFPSLKYPDRNKMCNLFYERIAI